MAKLVLTVGFALIVLCGATIAAHVRRTNVQTFAQGPSCVTPPSASAGMRPAPLPFRKSSSVAQTHARPAVQVTRNDGADATFELRPADDGSVTVVGTSGDLQMSKSVRSDGGFQLELTSGSDRISVSATGQATKVTRNGTTVSLPRGASSEENFSDVRQLLAGSKAVVQFRRVGAALTDADDRSGPGVAMVIADAAVGQLTGDVGAVRRAARYLARNGSSNTRPAALLPECFQTMEADMMFALNDYSDCLGSVWGNMFWEDLCAWRWVIEVESVWFTFIGCSAFAGIF
jgi:hypothetical protein